MKIQSRNLVFGYVRVVILGTLVAVVLAIIGLIIHWRPAKTVNRQQATLIDAVESKKGARFRRLLSNEYKDRWGFTVEDATEAMLDVRSQFMTLGITLKEQKIEIAGKRAKIITKFTLGGTPIGGGNEVKRHINGLDTPWEFTWKKQSFLPSSWRLVNIENEAIPDNVWGYEPGSIRRQMNGN